MAGSVQHVMRSSAKQNDSAIIGMALQANVKILCEVLDRMAVHTDIDCHALGNMILKPSKHLPVYQNKAVYQPEKAIQD